MKHICRKIPFYTLCAIFILSPFFSYAQNREADSVRSQSDLGEVVVTALGIKRESKSLSYTTQEIKSDQLNMIRETNPINSLNGKVAGLQLNRSASGAGGSVKVVLRGSKSTRDNSPLYVIDGLPITNNLGNQPQNIFGRSLSYSGSGSDGGDILATLSPDDIESITVLKGASAAALYGSQAANGAILITTRSGKSGRTKVNYSTSLTIDQPFVLPEFQSSYGSQGSSGAKYSWGDKYASPDFIDDFYRTGTNWINNISVSGGSDKYQTYFSYSNTQARGIIPENKYVKHTLMLKESAKVGKRLTVDGNVMLSLQDNHNQPVSGLYDNPLTGLYLFPRSLDFNEYKKNFEVYSPGRNLMIQNWWNINVDKGLVGDDNQQNPYWIINRVTSDQNTQRIYAAIQAKYMIIEGLNLQVRGNLDKSFIRYEKKAHATTQETIADPNGKYVLQTSPSSQYYTDVLLSFDKKFRRGLSLRAIAGGSYRFSEQTMQYFDSYGANLRYANIFSIQNIKQGALEMREDVLSKRELAAAFGNVQIGYKDAIVLDLTARNDWSSTLPGQSFFYPSIGISAVLSDLMTMPKAINFLKIRTSYTQVGNDIPPFANNPLNSINSVTGLVQNTVGPIPGTTLKPELSVAVEAGVDARFFNNALDLSATFYQNNTYDQYMLIAAPIGSGFTQYAINAGNIRNVGYEIVIGAHPFYRNKFKWDITLNLSQNFNEVVKLSDQLSNKQVALTEPFYGYGFYIDEGHPYGSIYGKKFARDNEGRIMLKNGQPVASGGFERLGNANPDALVGLSNSFSYKNFRLSFLIDGRIGGKVVSFTQAILGEYGVSKETADARDAGGFKGNFVDQNGNAVSQIEAKDYYTGAGGRDGIAEAFLYDATSIRMREISFGYSFPEKFLEKTKVLRALSINFIARNVFFFYKDAPYDPEVAMSSGTSLQGVDTFNPPSTSSFGFNLLVGF